MFYICLAPSTIHTCPPCRPPQPRALCSAANSLRCRRNAAGSCSCAPWRGGARPRRQQLQGPRRARVRAALHAPVYPRQPHFHRYEVKVIGAACSMPPARSRRASHGFSGGRASAGRAGAVPVPQAAAGEARPGPAPIAPTWRVGAGCGVLVPPAAGAGRRSPPPPRPPQRACAGLLRRRRFWRRFAGSSAAPGRAAGKRGLPRSPGAARTARRWWSAWLQATRAWRGALPKGSHGHRLRKGAQSRAPSAGRVQFASLLCTSSAGRTLCRHRHQASSCMHHHPSQLAHRVAVRSLPTPIGQSPAPLHGGHAAEASLISAERR